MNTNYTPQGEIMYENDRRERYAAAISEVTDAPDAPSMGAVADAAMAVADIDVAAEKAQMQDVLRREHDRANRAQQRADDYEGEIEALTEDNDRLRAELDTVLTSLERHESGHHN